MASRRSMGRLRRVRFMMGVGEDESTGVKVAWVERCLLGVVVVFF